MSESGLSKSFRQQGDAFIFCCNFIVCPLILDLQVKLSRRLGCRCLGTVIKGGSEGIQAQPERMNRKLFRLFFELGRIFGKTGQFDKKIVGQLARPVRFSKLGLLGARLGGKMGELLYWNKLLKKHGAYDKRFARPYEPDKQ